jgi:hypothetical protein
VREDIMQKKNILIAILCVTILLLVPFTSISSASVSGLNTKVEIVEEVYPNIEVMDISKFIEEFEIQEYLDINADDYTLEDLRDFVIKIDFLFGHYPEIAESCKNIIEILDIPNPELCEFYKNLLDLVSNFSDIVFDILRALEIYDTLIGTAIQILLIGYGWWLVYKVLYYCVWEPSYEPTLSYPLNFIIK